MNRTIAKIGYAPITARAATGYTYGNVKWFDENGGAGRNVSSTPFGETYSIFGNGRMIYGGEINNGRDLEVTLIDILDDIRISTHTPLARRDFRRGIGLLRIALFLLTRLSRGVTATCCTFVRSLHKRSGQSLIIILV